MQTFESNSILKYNYQRIICRWCLIRVLIIFIILLSRMERIDWFLLLLQIFKPLEVCNVV